MSNVWISVTNTLESVGVVLLMELEVFDYDCGCWIGDDVGERLLETLKMGTISTLNKKNRFVSKNKTIYFL